jgi:hypothetical protein
MYSSRVMNMEVLAGARETFWGGATQAFGATELLLDACTTSCASRLEMLTCEFLAAEALLSEAAGSCSLFLANACTLSLTW